MCDKRHGVDVLLQGQLRSNELAGKDAREGLGTDGRINSVFDSERKIKYPDLGRRILS
jgi:hypothetical protein